MNRREDRAYSRRSLFGGGYPAQLPEENALSGVHRGDLLPTVSDMENRGNDLAALQAALAGLTPSQLGWVRGVILQFKLPHDFQRAEDSDFVTDGVLERMGDALRIHHAFSRQALSKDRFEFALERALNLSGIESELVRSRTNRGHDITIAGVPVSLKTEAAANIRADTVHVSKWMELGRGEWILERLRDLFLEHMQSYDRIFTLRCLSPGPKAYRYELVELPKALMEEAANCEFQIMEASRQNPQPGYGYVRDAEGNLKYSLYFDGGTERKLQIRGLHKSLCHVHATWAFESAPLK